MAVVEDVGSGDRFHLAPIAFKYFPTCSNFIMPIQAGLALHLLAFQVQMNRVPHFNPPIFHS